MAKLNWSNRIVSYGQKPAQEFLAHTQNPKIHPPEQLAALRAALESIGWVDVVKENIVTGNLIDGHARIEEALSIDENMMIPYLQVELSEEEEKQVLITLDRIGQLATYDPELLKPLMEEIQFEDTALQAMMRDLAAEYALDMDDEDGLYTRTIETPLYEPSGEKPALSDLFDDSKTRALVSEIQNAPLSEEEKQFLILAAQRHTILNFSKVADYYAHSSPLMQQFMEDSALVIIDYDRAIELGFVRLTQRIAGLYDEQYGDE